MNIDNLLLDLEIINQIKENDKLAVDILPGKKTLIVDSSSYFSSISRKYKGYNRDDSIEYLDNLVDEITKSSNIINSGNHNDMAAILNKSIKSAIKGLTNLKNTYKNDSIIVAKIILLINKLNTITTTLEFSNITIDDINRIENNVDNNEDNNEDNNLN